MFASIDALSMRVVSCEAETEAGNTIRIDALSAVGPDRRDSLRALPSDRALPWLGNLLLGLDFVPESIREKEAHSRLRTENPGLDWSFDQSDGDAFISYRPYRISDPESDTSVRIASVKLRWWRIVFNHEGQQLLTEPIGEEIRVGMSAP